jgi:hypothetical protein
MYRVGFAILAVLLAAVLVSGAAYGAGALAHYAVRAITHIRPAATAIVSMTISIGAMYFCIWIGMRHRTRGQ